MRRSKEWLKRELGERERRKIKGAKEEKGRN